MPPGAGTSASERKSNRYPWPLHYVLAEYIKPASFHSAYQFSRAAVKYGVRTLPRPGMVVRHTILGRMFDQTPLQAFLPLFWNRSQAKQSATTFR